MIETGDPVHLVLVGGQRHPGQQLPAVEDRPVVADAPDRCQVVHRPAVVKARLVGDFPDGFVALDRCVLGQLDPDSQWLCHHG